MILKRKKLFIVLLVLLIPVFMTIIYPDSKAYAAQTQTLGGPQSETHRQHAPNLWDGALSPGSQGERWLLQSINNSRNNFHNWHIQNGYTDMKMDAIGLENPSSYSPPSGWEVHTILKYPVYKPRTYPISIMDCTKEKTGSPNPPYVAPGRDTCTPHTYQGTLGSNQWVLSISSSHWRVYDEWAPTWEGKTGPFYLFNAAQINGYAYDVRIKKIGSTDPGPDPDPGGGGDDGGGGDPPPPDPPPNPCDSGGCEEIVLTCPPPYHPPDIDRPFEYRLDLVTERIEGQTVEKGTQTQTPVTVYRADFSDYRQAIKDRLNSAISTNNALKGNCQSNISTMQSNLSSLYSKQSEIQSILSTCQATPNMDCTNVLNGQSQVSSAISSQSYAISAATSMLPLYDSKIQQILNYLQTIYDAEARYRIINTSVDLTYRNKSMNISSFIENKPVALAENERKVLSYYWILNGDGFVRAFIDPNDEYTACPKPGGACETNEANNIKETPVYIASHETVLSCSKEGETSQLSGITRTVTTGSGTQIYRETATSTLTINPQEKQRRAGFGFYYKVNTNYLNEDIAPTRSIVGVTISSPYKPSILANYLPYTYQSWEAPYSFTHGITQSDIQIDGYKVPNMFVSNQTQQNINGQAYQQVKEWELPQYSIEGYSGNVFEGDILAASTHPMHNNNDELLNGGRKWYLDFDQPDGQFVYNVLIPNVGVNKLNLCVTGEIDVLGSFIGDPNGNDDFVFRPIDPTNAFPDETGWNWQGYESIISSIRDWWKNWSYPNPNDVPQYYHENKFTLPRSLVKDIREYNETKGGPNKVELGDGFMGQHGFN